MPATATAPRQLRPCLHPRARHRHGTRAAYVKDRCHCLACTAANTAANRIRRRQQAYGRWHPHTDAAPVREHLAELRAAGIGLHRIAVLSDVSVTQLQAIAGGTSRVRSDTARRLLRVAVDPGNRAPRALIDAAGTARRLQALAAAGWTAAQIADSLGRTRSNLARTMTATRVTARTAQEVAALYARLEGAPPPGHTQVERAASDAARADAARQGWVPPPAWDDIDNDPHPAPPTAEPGAKAIDPVAVERAVARDGITFTELSVAEQIEAVRNLTSAGRSVREIADQLGATTRTVSRRRRAAVNAA